MLGRILPRAARSPSEISLDTDIPKGERKGKEGKGKGRKGKSPVGTQWEEKKETKSKATLPTCRPVSMCTCTVGGRAGAQRTPSTERAAFSGFLHPASPGQD